MNIQRLVSIGCVGFFMFLAVTSGLAASNSPTGDSNHPLPVRAPLLTQGTLPTQGPLPTQASAQTTPAAPGGTASQLLPQPQPVPVPPAAAATAAPTQVDSVPVSLISLLLIVAATGALIGLMVLGQGRQRANGRFPHPSALAQGAQS